MKRRLLYLLGLVGLLVLATQFFLSKKIWLRPTSITSMTNNPSMGPISILGKAVNSVLDPPKTFPPLPDLNCEPGVPCDCGGEVDLRVIVMVFNRPKSLEKVLTSLQTLEMDGDKGIVEIWIDRSKDKQEVDPETLEVAKQFKWRHGQSRVNVQKKHVGIYGQWIDTWRPKPDSKEIALFLEDDVDVSPYVYRWLKGAFKTYRAVKNIASVAVFEGAIFKMNNKLMPSNETAFLHQRMGSQGMAPFPNHWRDFQDWFHKAQKDESFHPYVKNDPGPTSWYKASEQKHQADSMWSIWYIYYNDRHSLWTLYTNLGKVMHARNHNLKEDEYLAFHRREKGLHFHGRGISSNTRLVNCWYDYLTVFPSFNSMKKFSYHGKLLSPDTWMS